MASVKSFVDDKIKNYKVAVFSKSSCPYCHKAKKALESFAYKPDTFYWLEIENRSDCQEIQDYLNKITGGRSVPRVFIGGKFFGGGDETATAHKNGQLKKALEAVEALG